jgi:hypothetical protein
MIAAGHSGALAFERSELARDHVNQTMARFSQEASALARRPRTAFRSRLLSPRSTHERWREEWDVRRVEDAIARLLSITEEFTFGLLIEVTERQLPANRVVDVLWEAHIDRATETWNQRMGAWNELHEVSFSSGFSGYDRLLGFIEARNAIVHGLGRLTRKQTHTVKARRATVGRLKAARIDVVGARLTLNIDHVTGCGETVRGFIYWLDGAAASVV